MAGLIQMPAIVEPYTVQVASDLMHGTFQDVPNWASSLLSLLPEIIQLVVVTCSMIFGWAVLPRALVWACQDAGFYDPAASKVSGSPKGAKGSLTKAVTKDSLAEAKFEAAAGDACAPPPARREPSWQSALALLESYGIFDADPGTWTGGPSSTESGPVDAEDDAFGAAEIPCNVGRAWAPEMSILEHYGVLGAAPGSWSNSSSDDEAEEACTNGKMVLPKVTVGILAAAA